MPHQNIIYLHLTHPFHSATSIHKPTSHIHQQSWQTNGKEPLEWCRRCHPLTPMVIFISLERPLGDCQFSLFTHHQLALFGLWECVRKDMKLKSWSFYKKKWKLKSCIWVSFLPFLHCFVSSSSQSRIEECPNYGWSQQSNHFLLRKQKIKVQ